MFVTYKIYNILFYAFLFSCFSLKSSAIPAMEAVTPDVSKGKNILLALPSATLPNNYKYFIANKAFVGLPW